MSLFKWNLIYRVQFCLTSGQLTEKNIKYSAYTKTLQTVQKMFASDTYCHIQTALILSISFPSWPIRFEFLSVVLKAAYILAFRQLVYVSGTLTFAQYQTEMWERHLPKRTSLPQTVKVSLIFIHIFSFHIGVQPLQGCIRNLRRNG